MFNSDAMFIAAHPDDAEICAAGLMASLSARGRRVILVDATRGEFATRGTQEERDQEAREAAEILGVERTCLQLPDGHIGHDIPRAVNAVVRAIREYRPRVVFTHTPGDHHPDHHAIHEAVRQAFFMANARKYETGQDRHGARRLMYFWSHRHELPEKISFISDVSDFWEKKKASLEAHRSQLFNPQYEAEKTYVSSGLFWHAIEARAAFFGSLIDVKYGEPYVVEGQVRLDDPTEL